MNQEPTTASPEPAHRSHLCFRDIFARANDALCRLSPSPSELQEKFVDALTVSSMAKCLDFNVAANDEDDNKNRPFFLAGNCRVICEELIYVSFLRSIDKQQANELGLALNNAMCRRSVLAQTRFFAANNPLQPTIGGFMTADEQEIEIRNAESNLNDLWSRHGFAGKNSPRIRDLSRRVSLTATYDYVYHMTSNFVHFNPPHLLKTGWGPIDGPFVFSVENFHGYYLDVARFLGAILFLGYVTMFPEALTRRLSQEYVETVTQALESNVRWPEIVTFEEMNQRPPPNILHRALMSTLRQTDDKAFPNILKEIGSL